MKKVSGFSLIEMSLVLLVITVMVLGATQVYRMVENNRRVNDAVDQILAVYQAGAQYNELPVSVADLIPQLVSNGYLDAQFSSPTVNPWGGRITATTTTVTTQIQIFLFGIPESACWSTYNKFAHRPNFVFSLSGCNTIAANPYLRITLSYLPEG